MKKIVFIIIYFAATGLLKTHAKSDFWYDKDKLNDEFMAIEINPHLSLAQINSISLKTDTTDFTIYDLELESFCTGFCCGPVGLAIFTGKDKTMVEKKSFSAGCISFAGSLVVGFVGLILLESVFFF